MTGIIVKALSGFYYVKTDGDKIIQCRARGKFRKNDEHPLVGDFAEITLTGDDGVVDRIVDRKNSLIRPPVANIDRLYIVSAYTLPSPDFSIIDRLTVIAEMNGIEPIIIITKSDLDEDFAKQVYDTYSACGFSTFITSSENGSGVDEIYEHIKEISKKSAPVCAFAGVSGAGKSTLINAIFKNLSLETGELSSVIEGEKGLFIAMPSRKAADGEYRDIAHPINSETRERIQSIILEKYEIAAAQTEEEAAF